MIKVVFQAIPVYPMALFRLPKSTIQSLERIQQHFQQKQEVDSKLIHLIKWSKLTIVKKYSGLGFKDFELFNQSLSAKQAWRLMKNPRSIVVRLLRGLYFQNGDYMKAKQGSRTSWIWQSILWDREALKRGILQRLGNGKSINVWGDPWIPTLPNF